jgi:alkylhydroperoxidase family enzyme
VTGNLQEVLDLRRWREAAFDQSDKALLGFAEKFTIASDRIGAEDLQELQDEGFTDNQIIDMVLCAGYRHYITRVADATGIEVDKELGISTILTEAYTHVRENQSRARIRPTEVERQKYNGPLRKGPWIRLSDDPEVNPSLVSMFSSWKEDCGFVPGLLLALSLRPLAVEKISSFWRLACFGGSRLGGLREAWLGATVALLIPSAWLLEMYRYLFYNQIGDGKKAGGFPQWRDARLPGREQAVLLFAELITERVNSITRSDVDQVKKAGLTDPEILDVIVATALLNALGRMANALGVPADVSAGVPGDTNEK